MPGRSSFVTILLLAAGLAIGATIEHAYANKKGPLSSTAAINCQTHYRFINPYPDCEIFEEKAGKLDKLDGIITTQVAQLQNRSGIGHISVWVRDLTTLRFAAVNENELYTPASLLKLPLMIAVYKYAELYPDVLDKKVLYASVFDKDQSGYFIPPSVSIELGQSYTVNELLEHMIRYSDNEAANLLASVIDPSFGEAVYLDLGIKVPNDDGKTSLFMTAKSYAAILRTLYNSSYLSRKYSDKALSLLSQTEYSGGLVAGVPKGTVVAHKFGERGDKNMLGITTSIFLNDCGIVYAKQQPYSACIMTEGIDFDALQKAIGEISKTVYENIY